MSERIFRMTSLTLVFALVFAARAWGGEASTAANDGAKAVTEMQKALSLANEIQALNRGDFDSGKSAYHPSRRLLLDDMTLSLSVKRK